MPRYFTLMSCLCLLVVTSVAQAQGNPAQQPRRPRGQQNHVPLTAEQLETAWKLQVKGFAQTTQLSDEQTEKVTEVYLDARENYATAQRELQRGENSGKKEIFTPAMGELLAEHLFKLHDTLDDIITDKPLKRAMVTLGSFNTIWDRMVDAISGFQLGDERTREALKPIEDFVAEVVVIRAGGAFQIAIQDMIDARYKLMSVIQTILTEEQNGIFIQIVDSGFSRRPAVPAIPGGRRGG